MGRGSRAKECRFVVGAQMNRCMIARLFRCECTCGVRVGYRNTVDASMMVLQVLLVTAFCVGSGVGVTYVDSAERIMRLGLGLETRAIGRTVRTG